MKKNFCILFIFLTQTASSFAFQAKENQHLKLYPAKDSVVLLAPEVDSTHSGSVTSIYQLRLDSLVTQVKLDYNPFVQNYIDLFLQKRSGEVSGLLAQLQYYLPVFEKALKAYQIPPEFKYLAIVESALNPLAVSRSGAAGLWQFMPSTGRAYGLQNNAYVDERLDPIASSYAAAAYLRDAYKELGDWQLALTAYNCGTGAVKKAIENAGGSRDFWLIKNHLSAQAQNYLPFFIAVNYVMNYYPLHSEIKLKPLTVTAVDSIYAKKYITLNQIQQHLGLNEGLLQSLNPVYKMGIVNGTFEAPRRIIIPKVPVQSFDNLYTILEETPEDTSLIAIVKSNDLKVVPLNGNSITHTVQKGENLTQIASKYGVSVDDIGLWNNLSNYSLEIGQFLTIYKNIQVIRAENQNPSFVTYTIKPGDTLTAIAEKFEHATIQSIKELNNLKSNDLVAGETLKINAN